MFERKLAEISRGIARKISKEICRRCLKAISNIRGILKFTNKSMVDFMSESLVALQNCSGSKRIRPFKGLCGEFRERIHEKIMYCSFSKLNEISGSNSEESSGGFLKQTDDKFSLGTHKGIFDYLNLWKIF